MKTTSTLTEYEIIREAEEILLKYLGPTKTIRFWNTFNKGKSDYLQIKKKIFKGESVDILYQKVKEYKKSS